MAKRNAYTLYDDEDPHQDDPMSTWLKVKRAMQILVAALVIYAVFTVIANAQKKPYQVVSTGYIGVATQILCDTREQVVELLTEWALNGVDAANARYSIFVNTPNEKGEPTCMYDQYTVIYGERTDYFPNLRLRDGTEIDQFVHKVFMAHNGVRYWMTSSFDVMSHEDFEEYKNKQDSERAA